MEPSVPSVLSAAGNALMQLIALSVLNSLAPNGRLSKKIFLFEIRQFVFTALPTAYNVIIRSPHVPNALVDST